LASCEEDSKVYQRHTQPYLFYAYGEAAELVDYLDSDWGGDQNERKTPLAMSSILRQLHFHEPQRSNELWPYLHVK